MLRLKYSILFVAFLCLAACSDSTDEAELNLIETKFDFTAAAGEGVVLIKSSDPVKVTSTQLWCTATVNGQTINVSVSPNFEISSRTALLTISLGETQKVVRVTQPGVIIAPEIVEEEIRLFASDQGRTISLATNATIQVSIDNPMFVVYHRNDSLYIITTENKTLTPKRGLITLSMGNTYKQIKVVQNPVWISPSVSKVLLSSGARRTAILFNKNLCSNWTATSNANWCQIEQVKDTLFVTVPTYTAGTVQREATIELASGEASISLPVKQYQSMPPNKLLELCLQKWYLDENLITGTFSNAVGLTKQSLAAIDARLYSICIKESDNAGLGSHQLLCLVEQGGELFPASFYFFTTTDQLENIGFGFNNQFGQYGRTFYDGIIGFKELVEALNGTFGATTDNQDNPTYIDLSTPGKSCRLSEKELLMK